MRGRLWGIFGHTPRGQPPAAERRKAALAGPQWNRRPDPQDTFLAAPSDRWVGQKAVIGVRLVDMPTAGSRQLIEQPLCFFQIGGVEALGEPTVDGGEQIMSLGPPALLAPQPSEARRRAQLIGLGTL